MQCPLRSMDGLQVVGIQYECNFHLNPASGVLSRAFPRGREVAGGWGHDFRAWCRSPCMFLAVGQSLKLQLLRFYLQQLLPDAPLLAQTSSCLPIPVVFPCPEYWVPIPFEIPRTGVVEQLFHVLFPVSVPSVVFQSMTSGT